MWGFDPEKEILMIRSVANVMIRVCPVLTTRMFRFLIIIAAVTLSGCAGQFVPIQTLDKTGLSILIAAEKIQTVPNDKAKNMYSLGLVVGHSCQNKVMVGESASSKVGAIDQLRIIAAQMGASAITEPHCEEGGFSLIKNCWNSWECTSTALR